MLYVVQARFKGGQQGVLAWIRTFTAGLARNLQIISRGGVAVSPGAAEELMFRSLPTCGQSPFRR